MSNFSQNVFMVAGRLCIDPELRVAANGDSVSTFTIAVRRAAASKLKGNKEPETDFFKVVAWKKAAEDITRFFEKGDTISIVGKVQIRKYEKDGITNYSTEVVVDRWDFVDSKAEKERRLNPVEMLEDKKPESVYTYNPYSETEKSSGVMESVSDEELPF